MRSGSHKRCGEKTGTAPALHSCTRPEGHPGEHVDSKIGRFAWGGPDKETVEPKEMSGQRAYPRTGA